MRLLSRVDIFFPPNRKIRAFISVVCEGVFSERGFQLTYEPLVRGEGGVCTQGSKPVTTRSARWNDKETAMCREMQASLLSWM